MQKRPRFIIISTAAKVADLTGQTILSSYTPYKYLCLSIEQLAQKNSVLSAKPTS